MEIERDTSTVWVQALVNNDAIAVPASQVREMVMLDNAVSRPNAAPEVRGLLNLRGRVLTLFDLRVMFGQVSAIRELEELSASLEQRKRDHELWLETLVLSIENSVPFTLARDPSRCAFGKWYGGFRTENAVLRMQLAKLTAPHRAIHALADETLAMAAAGDQKSALKRLEQARHSTLRHLSKLLDESVEILRDEHREVVLVLDRPGRGIGVLVDSVVGVRRIERSHVETVQERALGEIEKALLGLSKLDERMYVLLDLERIIECRGFSINVDR